MYIKPTQQLWTQIEQKISSMFKERHAYAANWFHYGMSKHEFEKRLMDSCITVEEDELARKLGEKWFTKAANISVHIHIGPTTTAFDAYTIPATTAGRSGFVPQEWINTYSNQRPRCKDQVIIDLGHKRREAMNKITMEQAAFTETVKKAWTSAPSVNALAKIWPPIVDLLPSSVVEKLQQHNTRRKAAEMSAEIDTQALSVHILKAKVGA